jgi:putative hydrolase of the HAD superfamily
MAIEAVVFDWGGVLAGNVSTGFADLEERLGVAEGSMPGLLGMQPTATDPGNLWHQRELGRATALEWAQWYADRVSAAGGPAIPVDLLVASEGNRFSIEPNTEIVDLVRRLSSTGYRLGLCTNNFMEVGDAWRAQLPMEVFDAVVVSCEIGLRKPDPAMYEFVTNALGVAPGSTVLLDDFEGNIDGARAVGWHAILVGSDHAAVIAALDDLLSAEA